MWVLQRNTEYVDHLSAQIPSLSYNITQWKWPNLDFNIYSNNTQEIYINSSNPC